MVNLRKEKKKLEEEEKPHFDIFLCIFSRFLLWEILWNGKKNSRKITSVSRYEFFGKLSKAQ